MLLLIHELSGLSRLGFGEILVVLVDLLSFVDVGLRGAVLVDTLLGLALHVGEVVVHGLPERAAT